MVSHESASTAVFPHFDDSPCTIYVNIHYTILPVFLKLETCRRYYVKLNYIRCAFGARITINSLKKVQMDRNM
jgi:hypothetical protein